MHPCIHYGLLFIYYLQEDIINFVRHPSQREREKGGGEEVRGERHRPRGGAGGTGWVRTSKMFGPRHP